MDEIYLPSLGGGIKANRFLMQELAGLGHECHALTRALTSSPDGPNDREEFLAEIRSRGSEPANIDSDVYSYRYEGVQVEAIDWRDDSRGSRYLRRRIHDLSPDWILVADDKRGIMVPVAIEVAADRTVLIMQTIMQLPFGPLSVRPDGRQTALMERARAAVVISRFLQSYVSTHSKLDAELAWLPVYGRGPFPDLGDFDAGYVTMINPCEMKGISIFLALADRLPGVKFAAVPTWGADAAIMDSLRARPNISVLPADDDIEKILRMTRILLVPSLWPETFGYVVPEAMLRGIPVLASNIGGLPEAKLGIDYLLPAAPAERCGDRYVCPPQDTDPWVEVLQQLLSDPDRYERCSADSRSAATEFWRQTSASNFEHFLLRLGTQCLPA